MRDAKPHPPDSASMRPWQRHFLRAPGKHPAFSSRGDAGASWPGLEADLLLCSCMLGGKWAISHDPLWVTSAIQTINIGIERELGNYTVCRVTVSPCPLFSPEKSKCFKAQVVPGKRQTPPGSLPLSWQIGCHSWCLRYRLFAFLELEFPGEPQQSQVYHCDDGFQGFLTTLWRHCLLRTLQHFPAGNNRLTDVLKSLYHGNWGSQHTSYRCVRNPEKKKQTQKLN